MSGIHVEKCMVFKLHKVVLYRKKNKFYIAKYSEYLIRISR
jgi:hypothetical protein